VNDETRELDLRDAEIKAAAGSLRKSWDSPRLWPRISTALALEAAKRQGQDASPPKRVGFFEDLFGGLAANWRPAWPRVRAFGAPARAGPASATPSRG